MSDALSLYNSVHVLGLYHFYVLYWILLDDGFMSLELRMVTQN